MKPRCWVDFVADWKAAPMAYWVHVEADGRPWREASAFAPPAPAAVPHRGYRRLNVEVDGFTFQFSSDAQLDACIDVLSKVPLPTTRRLSEMRGGGAGPNGHWLSRLPARLKSPKARRKVVKALQDVPGTLRAVRG